MIALKELKTGAEIDLEDRRIHKYWKPQGMWQGYVFIMQDDFNMDYDGFAICARADDRSAPEWIMFWRETVEKYGERREVIPGKFNDKPFIRMLVSKKDATEA